MVKANSIPTEMTIIARESTPCLSGQSHREARRKMRREMEIRGQCLSREESIIFKGSFQNLRLWFVEPTHKIRFFAKDVFEH
jgi:hypothetical protein